MAGLHEIVARLDEHLEAQRFSDAALNGLQVEGRATVGRVALGVSASLQLFRAAIDWGADAILVHHGLFWGAPVPVVGPLAIRLRSLLEAEISLIAYHIPLDAHPVDGNNAVLARRLSLGDLEPWGAYRGKTIGTLGRTELITADELIERAALVCGSTPLVFGPRRADITSVAVCTGSAGSMIEQAIASKADALITGEPGEPAQQLALESGTLVIGAGHYNTERFGVEALGERLAQELGVEVRFFDIPNPV